MLLFLPKYLFNMATIYKPPLKVCRKISSCSWTELEVGSRRGHQILDINLSHHNESVHGCKCSYFFVNLFNMVTIWYI